MTKDQNRVVPCLLVGVGLAFSTVDVRPKASCSQRILMAPYFPSSWITERSASMINGVASSIASQKGFSELFDGGADLLARRRIWSNKGDSNVVTPIRQDAAQELGSALQLCHVSPPRSPAGPYCSSSVEQADPFSL